MKQDLHNPIIIMPNKRIFNQTCNMKVMLVNKNVPLQITKPLKSLILIS